MKTQIYPAGAAWPDGSSCRMNALLFTPEEGMTAEMPLLIYLHGAGERGSNIENVYRYGLSRIIREGREIPAVVLCPQCPAGLDWNNIVEEVKTLIDRVAAHFAIKPDRIAITGSSMGGFGTWEMALTYPNFFSAIAPVAGGGMTWRSARLRTNIIRAYHGAEDGLVLPRESEGMVYGAKQAGADATLTLLPGKDHGGGIVAAYEDPTLVEALLTARRENFDYVPDICEEWY